MIKAIIVDDENINISNLRALLNRHCPNVEVIAVAGNAVDARQTIMQVNPDLVFLDIEMPGEDGFALLRSLPQRDFEVIFVTAFDSYGITAIRFSALDYLLKPINKTELLAAVERAEQTVTAKKRNVRFENLLNRLGNLAPDTDEKIALPTQKEVHLVRVKDILYCESSNNYTTFFLTDGTSHLISRPLFEYDALLTPYSFIRCHQSFLVNKRHVISILNQDSGYLVMEHTSRKIPISKQRKHAVRSYLVI